MRIALAVVVLTAVACAGGDATTTTRVPGTSDTDVTVLEVLDGDSLRLDIDGEVIEARLVGINAPERNECFADRARDAVEQLTAADPLEFRPVTNQRDQFGRVLGSLVTPGGDVGLSLVTAGLAVALDVDHPDRDALLQAESTARRDGVGLWADDACGPSSGTALSITAVEPNPPGRDEDALADEWVEITNDGDGAIELGGFVLRDESSQHRFMLPEGFELASGRSVRVRTGCGSDTAADVFWCADGPVWNNGGDLVMLLDRNGSMVAARRYP